MTQTTCRVCGGKNLNTFLDLGNQPPANSLLDSPDEQEESYPLALRHCADCELVQLGYTVAPEKLFSHYVWVTGTSKGAQEFSKVFCEKLLKRAGDDKSGYVLEIASNDGTFLKPFVEKGYDVLGVDPAENIVEMAEKERVPTKCAFWGSEEARALVKERDLARIIFARNVLPHVSETNDFVEGLAFALREDGILAIEAHYAKVILDDLHYDSIYHEHLCYFTLKTLEHLLEKYGLYVFDVDTSPISGGSIVVYARKERGEESEELKARRKKEEKEKVNSLTRWEEFAKKSEEHKEKLLHILKAERDEGRTVVGWGASARSSTMLNFCKVDTTLIQEIADMNPLKQGKWTAGMHIPIEHPEVALKRDPDSLIILAWNFKDEIKEQAKQMGYRGTYIIPLPNDPSIET